MEECPLMKSLLQDPMKAREFRENHNRLPLWVRTLLWIVGSLPR